MYGKYSKIYAEWCQYYDPNNLELAIIEKYCPLQGKSILDIGCGTGRFLFRVLPKADNVIGIDYDREATDVLKYILLERYREYLDKVSIFNSSIEAFDTYNGIVDVAVFSWSFYALDEKQMRKGLSNLHSILIDKGTLIILQPVGGQFEKIMRMFFEEHESMDEYSTALERMNKVADGLYIQIAKDRISSEFVFSDLNMLCDALRMFAITEGGCKEEDLSLMTVDNIRDILEPYRTGDKYHLNDWVDVFIFRKK